MGDEYSEREKRTIKLIKEYYDLTKDSSNFYNDSPEIINKKQEVLNLFNENCCLETMLLCNLHKWFLNWETLREDVHNQREYAEEEFFNLLNKNDN